MRGRGFPSWLGGLGVFAGLLFIAVTAAPRIVSKSPTGESPHVPSSAPIRVEFNRSMDRISVETRLTVDPPVPGQFSWDGNVLSFAPLSPWPTNEIIRVNLAAGARSTRFLPILSSQRWSFRVDPARLAYLWPADGAADIYLLDLDTGDRKRLTASEAGVLDFSFGTHLAYTALTPGGSTQIRELDLGDGSDRLVAECPPAERCQAASISPDGAFIAFERYEWQTSDSGRTIPGPRQIWLGLRGDEPRPLTPIEGEARSPGWSPSGQLTYYDETLGAVVILDPETLETEALVPNGLGFTGTWSPDGRHLVLPEIVFPDETEGQHAQHGEHVDLTSHLYKIDVDTERPRDLSDGLVEDASPAYAPNGAWIAFGRKYLDERWTPGRQLWLMSSDGGSPRAILYDAEATHTSIIWDPDATMLAYMRLDQSDSNRPPEIWLTDLSGDDQTLLVEEGFLPTWIP